MLLIYNRFFFQKTHEEYIRDYLTPPTLKLSEGVPHNLTFNVTYPSRLDWRIKGFVTEVGLLAEIVIHVIFAIFRSKIKGHAVHRGHLVQQEH